jgi:hypothetical protein
MGAVMPTEQIGDYEIEYSGVHLAESEGWTAWVAIYGPSRNPMHRQPVVPSQRVEVETHFSSQQEAEQAARRIGIGMLEEGHHRASPG